MFAARTDNGSITAYKTGKVLFQGHSPDVEAKKWGATVQKSKPKKEITHEYSPPESLFTSSHIGSDEAGTGDFFGPMTVAAAYVPEEKISKLKELGVRDSKNLKDDKIKVIAKEIIRLGIPYSLIVLHNKKYNRLQQNGWTQGKMKTILHHQVIAKVSEKIAPEQPAGILIDQFSEPSSYLRHLKSETKEIQKNVYFITKAESYSIAVAAASIIARTSFLHQMDKLSEQTGVLLPKGAAKKVDQAASNIIKKDGPEALGTCAKTHFANTKKAEAYL